MQKKTKKAKEEDNADEDADEKKASPKKKSQGIMGFFQRAAK